MSRSLTALSVLLLTSALAAQPFTPVCITGRVERSPGVTICMQGETHYLADTLVYLKSSLIDLTRYEGQTVRLVGRDVGVTCRVLEVTSVMQPRATLSWCGSASTCCTVKLKLCPGGLGRGVIMAATRPGYAPLGCAPPGFSLDGTFLLDRNAFPIWVGPLMSCAELPIAIPCSNSLVGAVIWFQGARQDIGPVGPLSLTNVVHLRLAPFLPPCAPTNC